MTSHDSDLTPMIANETLLSSVHAQIDEAKERFCANAQERQRLDFTLNELLRERDRIVSAIAREQNGGR